MSKTSIKKGDVIKVEYTGSLEDETVFDSSIGKDPLEFEVGSGQLIKGFDNAVIGMKLGEEKEVRIEPEEAYGYSDPNLTQKVKRDQLPVEEELQVGMTLMGKGPDGREFMVRVTNIKNDDITIDMNHPLAGKILKFKIKIIDVKE